MQYTMPQVMRKTVSYVYNHSPAPYLSSIAVHLRGIHHEAPRIAPRPTHQPLPKDALDAEVDNLGHVEPATVGNEVPEQTPWGVGQQALVGELQVVKVGGLGAGAPVDVAEDVEARLDTPELAEEVWASEVEVAVVFLFGKPRRECYRRAQTSRAVDGSASGEEGRCVELVVWRWDRGGRLTGGVCVTRMSV